MITIGNPDKASVTGDSVVVRIALPKKEHKSWDAVAMLGGLYGESEYDVSELEIRRSDLPPDCLKPHENPETTPDIEGREFEILVCPLPDQSHLPNLMGLDAVRKPGHEVKDAWEMREQFFDLEDSVEATLQFLNRWGMWSARWVEQVSPRPGLFQHALVFPHRLWSLREAYKKAAAGSPRSWLTRATPLTLREAANPPYFIVERSYCEDAIKATLTIDHLENVKFGICKRHDCRKLFKRKTAQKRLYCTLKCAHRANVRKLRKAKAKAMGKGTKKNATRKNQGS